MGNGLVVCSVDGNEKHWKTGDKCFRIKNVDELQQFCGQTKRTYYERSNEQPTRYVS